MLAAEYVGHVVGGWEYVGAAYGITWASILAYSAFLFFRRRSVTK